MDNAIPTIFDFPSHLQKPPPKRRRPLIRVAPKTAPNVASASHQEGQSIPSLKECAVESENVQKPGTMEANGSKRSNEVHMSSDEMAEEEQLVTPCPMDHDYLFQSLVMPSGVSGSGIRGRAYRKRKEKIKKLTLKQVVQGMRKHIADNETSMAIESRFSDILDKLLKDERLGVPEYSEDVKQFAVTLNFYSSKAYDYLRSLVRLPDPGALHRWVTAVDGKPGFMEESFDILKKEVAKARFIAEASCETSRLTCCLMLSEISIKQQADFDGRKVVGYPDLGQCLVVNNSVQTASSVLVFMVTAVNGSWKLPIGYSFLKGLGASARANIVSTYLTRLHEVGVECVAVTCSGDACNVSMLTELGVVLDSSSIKNWFSHPSDPSKMVFAFLDTGDMLKRMRNLLAEKRVIVNSEVPPEKSKILWRHLERLSKLQRVEGSSQASSQGTTRRKFESERMKTLLSIWLLSRSVSSALKLCEGELQLADFKGASAAAEFVDKLEWMFELLSSCHPFGKGRHAPIRQGNRELVLSRIQKAILYLEGLCETGSRGRALSETRQRLPVVGLILNLMSLRDLAEKLVWKDTAHMQCLLADRFSLDHLETFLSTIWEHTGDRKPSACQFQSAYQQCLFVQMPTLAIQNCLSASTVMLTGSVSTRHFCSAVDVEHPEYPRLSILCEDGASYISSYVAGSYIAKSKCPFCASLVLRSNAASLGSSQVGHCSGLVAPSEDLIRLLKCAETVWRCYSTCSQMNDQWLLRIQCKTIAAVSTLNIFRQDHLFTSVSPGGEQHYSVLLKDLLAGYFTLRAVHLCKEISQCKWSSLTRQGLPGFLLFKG